MAMDELLVWNSTVGTISRRIRNGSHGPFNAVMETRSQHVNFADRDRRPTRITFPEAH